MQLGALAPYEDSLRDHAPLGLRHDDGRRWPLDIGRWLAPVDDADRSVVARAAGPALDVGCGPGRIVEALSDHGVFALGIDIAPTAVRLTRARGMNALRRDVFGPLPGAGRWGAIVLLDGNIGIGGEPTWLLGRAAALIGPAGSVLVETHPDAELDERLAVRFDRADGPVGATFPWAHVGVGAIGRHAGGAGLAITDQWTVAGRTFVELRAAR